MGRSELRLQKRRRGFTIINALVASLIVATCLGGMVSMFYFSINMTRQSDEVSVAYSLARQAMEQVKETGFANTAESVSPSYTYFDNNGNLQSQKSASTHFQLGITVVSSSTVNGSNPVQPSPAALRTVTITVTNVSNNQQICQMNTYLARAGI